MADLILAGSVSGTVTLSAPSSAGTVTVTLPSTTGTMLTSASTITPSDGSVTPAKMSGAQAGSAPAYAARAWVNFDGTGTPAIRASGNVSSITDNGTGDYTVNLTTAMPDVNYAAVTTSGSLGTSFNTAYNAAGSSTSAVVVKSMNASEAAFNDIAYFLVAIFR